MLIHQGYKADEVQLILYLNNIRNALCPDKKGFHSVGTMTLMQK
jgi:hypothetical protein